MCIRDSSWLEIGVYLKLWGVTLGEITGTMEQQLPLCSRGNSKLGGRPALRAHNYRQRYVDI